MSAWLSTPCSFSWHPGGTKKSLPLWNTSISPSLSHFLPLMSSPKKYRESLCPEWVTRLGVCGPRPVGQETRFLGAVRQWDSPPWVSASSQVGELRLGRLALSFSPELAGDSHQHPEEQGQLWRGCGGRLRNVGPTYCGLSHWRVLNFTPVPQVREQEPNGVQAPQLPSRLRMSGVSQMQCPLKQC
jgi:hypothetical protein